MTRYASAHHECKLSCTSGMDSTVDASQSEGQWATHPQLLCYELHRVARLRDRRGVERELEGFLDQLPLLRGILRAVAKQR